MQSSVLVPAVGLPSRFTVADGLQAGFALIWSGFRYAWAPLAFLAAAYILSDILLNGSWPRSDLAMITGYAGFPFYVIAVGALLRLSPLRSSALQMDEFGPGGLQWRGVEWRQLVIFLVLMAVMGAAWTAPRTLLLPLVPVDFPIEIHLLSEPRAWAAFLQDRPDAFDFALVGLEVLIDQAPAFALMVAFSLAVAATGATGKVQLLSAVRMSGPYLLPLLVGVIAITMPAVAVRVISIAMHAIFGDPLLPSVSWTLRIMEDLANTLATPLEVGFFAEAYRRISARAQDVF